MKTENKERINCTLFLIGASLLVIFGASLLVISGLWVAIRCGQEEFVGDRYSQVEVFTTERDYIEFKEYLAVVPIKDMEIDILASEPPIIVDYSITVPHGTEWNRGGSTNFAFDGKEWIMGIIGGACLLLSLFLPPYNRKNEESER